MALIQENINQLKHLKRLIIELSKNNYSSSFKVLSGSTIGQHSRHIIEFYSCLKESTKHGVVCYDQRKRNRLIEENAGYAAEQLDEIMAFIEKVKADQPISLLVNYTEDETKETKVKSTLYRELAYVLDHCIHHMAMIKTAIISEELSVELSPNFGVAPSTVRYLTKCAQ